jgi:hypothetical protein
MSSFVKISSKEMQPTDTERPFLGHLAPFYERIEWYKNLLTPQSDINLSEITQM